MEEMPKGVCAKTCKAAQGYELCNRLVELAAGAMNPGVYAWIFLERDAGQGFVQENFDQRVGVKVAARRWKCGIRRI